MKKFCILFLMISIYCADVSYTQPVVTGPNFGGGSYKLSSDFGCMTAAQHAAIKARLMRNIDSLKAAGIISDEPTESREAVELFWPLSSILSDPGYHRMGHFPDHDNRKPGHLRDYMGGDRTYDRSDYNHQGTDFYGWPFSWRKMDNFEVQVIAAAPGVIIDKDDGNYDRECATLTHGNFTFNSIYIRHSDGSIAWYTHFKRGSLTSLHVGQTVQVGDYLGVIGSSGMSWEPHLHFELEDSHGDLIDPNVGPYNQNPPVTWAPGVQQPYYDSAINKLMTHLSPPRFLSCPNSAIINEKNVFDPGDTLYVAAYYRDQLSGQIGQYTIYRPDNTIFQTWTDIFNQDFPHPSTSEPDWSNASHWYWGWVLPLDSPGGNWKVEVVYEGITYEHNFVVNADDPLPVFLSSFQLEQQDNSVFLTWNTESEVNNQGFIIKRKTKEELQYAEIANCSHNPELIGKGTYSGNSVYRYCDGNILLGQYYQYQLLSVTYLGNEEIIASGEIQTDYTYISNTPQDIQLYQNYPNPFNGYTVIPYFLPELMSVNVSVYNLLGQKIMTLANSENNEGNHKLVWNTGDTKLNSGIYFIVLKTPKTTLSNRCLIIN